MAGTRHRRRSGGIKKRTFDALREEAAWQYNVRGLFLETSFLFLFFFFSSSFLSVSPTNS